MKTKNYFSVLFPVYLNKIIIVLFFIPFIIPITVHSQTDSASGKEQFFNASSFSIKAGYHSNYLSSHSFSTGDGVIVDASASLELVKNFFIGINTEYWVSKFESEGPDNETYENTHTGWGIVFNMCYKIQISKFSIDAGLGVGPYKITFEGENYHNRSEKYIDLKVFTQLDYKISRLFYITADISYNLLYHNIENGRDFYNIKIGPTLIIPFKN